MEIDRLPLPTSLVQIGMLPLLTSLVEIGMLPLLTSLENGMPPWLNTEIQKVVER